MPIQTGTLAGPNEILSSLAAFLSTYGWTVDNSSAEGANGWKLTVHRGTAYYAMRSSNGTDTVSAIGVQDFETNSVETGIWIVGGDGIQVTGNWYDLSGRLITNTTRRQLMWLDCDNQAGPFNYWAFTNTAGPHEFWLVVEFASGQFSYLGFSDGLNLLGDWGQGTDAHVGAWYGASRHAYWTNQPPNDTGALGNQAPFCCVNSSMSTRFHFRDPATPSAEIRGETFDGYVDGTTGQNRWHGLSNRFASSVSERYGYTARYHIDTCRGMGSNLIRATPNAFNLSDVLVPFITMRERRNYFPNGGSANWSNSSNLTFARSPMGYPDFIRYCDMSNLNPGDTLVIGADTWYAFPDFTKGQLDVRDLWSLDFTQSGYAVRA